MVVKENPDRKKKLCPLDLTKRYYVLAGIDKQCDKYIFRGIENAKNSQKLRKIDKPLSYTTVRGHVLDLLANIGLDPMKFGLHNLQSGGASAAANLSVNDRLFKNHGRWKSDKVKDSYVHEDIESKLSVSRNPGLYPLPLLLSTRDSTTTKNRVFDVTPEKE